MSLHQKVGSQHVFTSPDLPGLFVAHADRETAEKAVPSAVKMLRQMALRRKGWQTGAAAPAAEETEQRNDDCVDEP